MSPKSLLFAASLAVVSSMAWQAAPAANAQDSVALSNEITWDDLWPPGEDERIAEIYDTYIATLESDNPGGIIEGGALDQMMQFGTFTTVEELHDTRVRVPGFVVPLDFSADNEYTEFLIVPYFGACLHTPPPPPNQIIFARTQTPAKIEDIYIAYWFEGVLKAERNDTNLADAAYSLELSELSEYRWQR